jgi:hypothetical protein
VGVWDLSTRTPLLRVRAEAAADFVAMSGHRATSPETAAAQSRQANSCALALAVRARITPEPVEKP